MSDHVLKTVSSDEYHYAFGEVYAPGQVDTDGEGMLAEDILKMAHDFIANGKVKALDMEHSHVLSGAEVVESFIARESDPDFTPGSWVLGIRMKDGPLWDKIKSGEINGFSVEASVIKLVSDIPKNLPEFASGETEPPVDQEGVEPHTHAFFVEFDSNGRVAFGKTDSAEDGHSHEITGTVTTNKSLGHSHRFFVR